MKGTNIYKAIYIKEIESITFKLSKKKVLIPDGFTYEFYQTLKEEIIQIIHNIFKKKNRSYEVITTLTLKPDSELTRKFS